MEDKILFIDSKIKKCQRKPNEECFALRREFRFLFSNTRDLKLFPKYYITSRYNFTRPPKKFSYKKITLLPYWSVIKLGSTEHDINIPNTEISWKISEKSGNKLFPFLWQVLFIRKEKKPLLVVYAYRLKVYIKWNQFVKLIHATFFLLNI